jgi:CheY-like chemotaxis protein
MARLLFVDDDATQIKLWRMLLEMAGHQIETAETLAQAIDRLAALPDVLLMDLRLPEVKDGLALIRKAGERDCIKIVVLSGFPQDLEVLPERKLVSRVLAKPVRATALLRAIAEVATVIAACYGFSLPALV